MNAENKSTTDDHQADWLEVVQRRVESLRFGSVQIVVHEGRVTQVESLEKTRFASSNRETAEHSRGE